ncbi:hypothetical protein GCM10010170_061910 [Dactylosporangium salmoneum]|uniref:Uncharacterized protein n=1 Tax=Dactylosporangium salmoneum TaxID=53361 RepID=A0ABN3GYL8_9ACTN
MPEAAPVLLGDPQRHGHEGAGVPGGDVGPVERARVAPAQEVQVGPAALGEVARDEGALGLPARTVDEGGADVVLGQRFHAFDRTVP